jgi:hypothetical protein
MNTRIADIDDKRVAALAVQLDAGASASPAKSKCVTSSHPLTRYTCHII